ncbi:MAG: transglutaminase family protein [Candidatus Latescibacteria bacterium]|nr:transglutaminase family protein [Candidatus Latescibacterota bacterium]
MSSPHSDPFFALTQGPDEQIDLVRCALLIARDAYPQLDVEVYAARVAGMAAELGPRCAGRAALERLRELNHYLFEEQGFRGSPQEHYYDPRNSYLNEVLERRLGIPITLALLYLAVGRQLGLVLEGVNFPGHFLVRCALHGEALFVDPFTGGRILETQDLEELLRRVNRGQPMPLEERFLRAASPRQILARMLRNLKQIHIRQRQFTQAIRAGEQILWLQPSEAEDYRDLGYLYYQVRDNRRSLEALEEYLRRTGEPEDAGEVRSLIQDLATRLGALN